MAQISNCQQCDKCKTWYVKSCDKGIFYHTTQTYICATCLPAQNKVSHVVHDVRSPPDPQRSGWNEEATKEIYDSNEKFHIESMTHDLRHDTGWKPIQSPRPEVEVVRDDLEEKYFIPVQKEIILSEV